jgi:hypothetical protein
MILPPPQESKAEPDASKPAARESRTTLDRSAFPGTAFREPTLRSIAALRQKGRSAKAFRSTAFREPVLWAVARQHIEG